jgi:hypothetical protein
MGNVFAVNSVGDSLVTYLNNVYPTELRTDVSCTFQLFSSRDMQSGEDLDNTTGGLYLYRITIDEHLRGRERTTADRRSNIPLALNLHYLFTVWTDSAFNEQTVMTWVLRELYQHPILDRSSLTPEAEWEADDVIHIIPAELSNEDMMRIWDGLDIPYRLSFSCIARPGWYGLILSRKNRTRPL